MAWTKTYTGEEPQRVNKWLAQSGVCSRREAEALIAQGAVSINGEKVADPGRKIAPGETLTLAQKGVEKLEASVTAVLNKPVGYVSAQPEKDQIPAARLISSDNLIGQGDSPDRSARLAPAGRLDMDSRGLLILTQDGVLTKSVIGPTSGVDKEYLVTVNGKITPDKVAKLCHGLKLDGVELRPAIVTHEEDQLLRFILREGRNRQIRRMCELVGLHVIDLFRIRIGGVKVKDLPEGKWRHITPAERTSLLNASKDGPTKSPTKRRRPSAHRYARTRRKKST